MDQLLSTLALPEIFVAAIVGFCVVVGMMLRTVTTVITGSARERSRREIAAYIAEGSLTPEQGERILKADIRKS